MTFYPRRKFGQVVLGLLLSGAGVAAAAEFVIEGNLNVVGDGTSLVEGSLIVGGNVRVENEITAHGDVVTLGSGMVTDLGSLAVMKGQITAPKFYATYSAAVSDGNPATGKTVNMGQWDVCYLSTVTIEGEDGGEKDSATCQLTGPSQGTDYLNRASWTLKAVAGSTKIDEVSCNATCMSFSPHKTGS